MRRREEDCGHGEQTDALPSSFCRLVLRQQISRKLERGVGFSEITSELRSGREGGGPSRRSGGQQLAMGCWPAGSMVPGEMSTWVHVQSGLIYSAAHGATCFN